MLGSKPEIQKIYPLTPMQEGMLFHSIKDSSGAYVEQMSFDARGMLHAGHLEQSLNKLIERYEVLRTVFRYKKVDRPLQIVLRSRKATIAVERLPHLEGRQLEQAVREFEEKDRMRGFDLSKDIPMRITVLQTGTEHYRIVWSYHHIIMDGWCSSRLFQDFLQFYNYFEQGIEPRLDDVFPFSAYVNWLERQDREEAEGYWRQYLSGIEQPTPVPGQKQQPAPYALAEYEYVVGSELTQALERMAKAKGVTVNSALQAAWGLLLQRYNGTEDAVFGAVVSGRPPDIAGIEQMVGLFINTVPVRLASKPGHTFIDLAQQAQQDQMSAQSYAYLSLPDVQALSGRQHDLIQHLFVFENASFDDAPVPQEDDTAIAFEADRFQLRMQTNYDFNVIVHPGQTLTVKIVYNAAKYEAWFVRNVCGHFGQLLAQAAAHPAIPVTELSLVTEEESRQLSQFRGQSPQYPRGSSIVALFAEQVRLNPNHLALVQDGKEQWTYARLDEESGRLAALLQEKGAAADCLVGIMADRSIEMVTGILAILKAGGAYVPIAPTYPEQRVRYMAKDSGISLLLLESGLEPPKSFQGTVIPIKGAESGTAAQLKERRLAAASEHSPEQLAYVMYTSGSTGEPKGVMINHRNVIRLVKETNYATFEPGGKILLTGAVAFDATTFEIWGALLNGLTLYLVNEETILNADKLADRIRSWGIDTMWLTSPLFNQLSTLNPAMFYGMKQLLVGGDALSPVHISKVRRACPGLIVINGYGPTENTTFSVCFRIDRDYERSIPIGYPIHHTTAYIVDRYGQLAPVGIPGELYVGGDGVARGYLNKDELTRERFIPDPYEPGGTLYRTGDMAKWLPDGKIEYIGRMDGQVKIRGYRIETGEIESLLLLHPAVKQAVVIVKETAASDKQLLAYYVPERAISSFELKCLLKESLPEYMVPKLFIPLQSMPLTGNGKIDKASLPAPDQSDASRDDAFEAPRTHTEIRLAALWEALLDAGRIGRDDHFFEQGGHSLKATQLVAQIQKTFEAELSIKSLYDAPKLYQLAELIEQAASLPFEHIPAAKTKEHYAVSVSQRSLLSLDQYAGPNCVYNIPNALLINGSIEPERIRIAFERLIERHEALRTSFHFMDDGPVQRIHPSVSFEMAEMDYRELWASNCEPSKLDALFAEFIKPFDLAAAPLFRAALVRYKDDAYVLMTDMHHIVSDGTSLGIVMKEFVSLYHDQPLEPLAIQYKDVAEWQKGRSALERYRATEKYWLDVFAGTLPVLKLATDDARPKLQDFKGGRLERVVPAILAQQIRQLAARSGTTLYPVLLAALNVLLHRYTGQEDIVIGCPVAGRTHADMEPIVGMFVNTLAYRNRPSGNKSFAQLLEEVSRHVRGGLIHQDYPFEELIKSLKLARKADRNPLFDVALVLQNTDAGMPGAAIRNVTFEPYPFDPGTAQFDLMLQVVEQDDELLCTWDYAASLFRQETIERMHQDWAAVLEQVCGQPEMTLEEVLLTRANRKLEQSLTEEVTFHF